MPSFWIRAVPPLWVAGDLLFSVPALADNSAAPPLSPPEKAPTTAPPSLPASPPGPPPAAAEPTAEPTVVNVVGRAPRPNVGSSDYRVELADLARVPRQNATSLLTLAPGIMLTNEGGDGHAEQIFLRGFDAREGQDLEISAGGVPINESGNLHGNGYADAHFIIPELVESLRIVEGPFDPRQGNYAVAGSAEYDLGLAQRGLTARFTLGSFNTQRLLLLWGPRDESTRTFGGVELYRSDGYGQNRDSKRATAMSQYEGSLGKNTTFRVGATAYVNSYHSAGVVREDDFEAGRIGFYGSYDQIPSDPLGAEPAQGGDASRYSASADIESKSGDTLYRQQIFAVHRGMRILENFTGFLLDVQTPIQSPHAQRGDLIDLAMTEETIGARGSARFRGKALGRAQDLELGYFARGDHVTGTEQRIEAATGHPYKLETDLVSSLADLGLYADLALHPLSWITVRGGLRGDLFAFDVLDRCAVESVAHPSKTNPEIDRSCLDQEDFGNHREPTQRSTAASLALLPRGSIIVGPIRDFSFSLSAGKGARSIDPSYIAHDAATPFASVVAFEGGVSYARSFETISVVARSTFFQTHVARDLVFSETAGRNVLGGGSTRTGWAGSARVRGDHFDVSASATLVKSVLDDTGLLVPYVPDAVVRADGAVFGTIPWKVRGESIRGSLGAGFTFVGHRPLPYGQRSDLMTTLDAAASVGWSHYEIGLTATNVLGQQYRLGEYDFASDFHTQGAATLVPVRHFTAGAPRAIFGTIAATFGGD